jgi:hypothetical protein
VVDDYELEYEPEMFSELMSGITAMVITEQAKETR